MDDQSDWSRKRVPAENPGYWRGRMARGRPAMNDAMGTGMLRGWVMLWNMGLTALLAAIVLVLAW